MSCVLPTANRPKFVAQAVRYFLSQDYPHRELVVVDDGDVPVADVVRGDARIRYVRHPGGLTLGAKRNFCVSQCRGDLVMHWDDDDWMAAHRISYQVAALDAADAEVCGLAQILFHEPLSGRTWLYDYPTHERAWLAGGSLLYTKAFWERAPFPDVQVASDTTFVWSQPLHRVAIVPDYRFYVALIHPRNTSPKYVDLDHWTSWPGNVHALFGADAEFYDGLAEEWAREEGGEATRPPSPVTPRG